MTLWKFLYVFDENDKYLATMSSVDFSDHLRNIIETTQKDLGELNILKPDDAMLLLATKKVEADFISNNYFLEWIKPPNNHFWIDKQGNFNEPFVWSWLFIKKIANKNEYLSTETIWYLYNLLNNEIEKCRKKPHVIKQFMGKIVGNKNIDISDKTKDIEDFTKILAVKMKNIDVWVENELTKLIAWTILYIESTNLFFDNNKMMTRIIANYILKYFNKSLIIFRPFAEKQRYDDWIISYKNNNSTVKMEKVIFDMRKRSIGWLENYIKEFRWKMA